MGESQTTSEYTEQLLNELEKKRTKSDYMLGSSPRLLSLVHYWIPTGCYPLDAIISRGIPGGRLIELSGNEATGKSILSLSILAQVQRLGGIGVLLDPETTTTMDIVGMAGVDPDNLIVGYPRTVEDVHAMGS